MYILFVTKKNIFKKLKIHLNVLKALKKTLATKFKKMVCQLHAIIVHKKAHDLNFFLLDTIFYASLK